MIAATLNDDAPASREHLHDQRCVVVGCVACHPGTTATRREQHGLAARKGLRPTMCHLAVHERRYGVQLAAGRRHAHQTSALAWREDDCVVLHPCSAATIESVAHGHDGATCDGHLLQFAAGKKTDPLTVRRKERTLRAVGSRQRRRPELRQSPQIELRGLFLSSLRDEGDDRPVR